MTPSLLARESADIRHNIAQERQVLPEPAARGCVIQDGGFPPSALIRSIAEPSRCLCRPSRQFPILALQRKTKLILDLYLSTLYGYASPTEGLAPCSSRRWFDGTGGSRAPDGRARAAVLATRCCRKDEPKRTGGNTGNTGNPLAGIRRPRFVNDIRRFGVSAGRPVCAGWAGGNGRKPAETPCKNIARDPRQPGIDYRTTGNTGNSPVRSRKAGGGKMK